MTARRQVSETTKRKENTMEKESMRLRLRPIAYGLLGGVMGGALVTGTLAVAGGGATKSATSTRALNACLDANSRVHVYGGATCPGGETKLTLSRALTDAEIDEMLRLQAAAEGQQRQVKRSLHGVDKLLKQPGNLGAGEIKQL